MLKACTCTYQLFLPVNVAMITIIYLVSGPTVPNFKKYKLKVYITPETLSFILDLGPTFVPYTAYYDKLLHEISNKILNWCPE